MAEPFEAPLDTSTNLSQAYLYNGTDTSSILPQSAPQSSALERTTAIAVPVVFAFIIVFGFLGNLLVILVISCNKRMRNSTNLLIVNLAVADLSFILVCIPFTAYKYSNPLWIFGDTWCRIYNYTSYVCAWASVYTLVLMCIDRLFAVVFAIRFPTIRSKKNVIILIALMWTVVFLANIPAFMFHGEVVYTNEGVTRKTCAMLRTVDEKKKQIFQVCFFTFGFLLPVVTISVLYTALVISLLRRKGPKGSDNRLNQTKRRVTVLVITVVTVFIVCWLPIQIILLLGTFKVHFQRRNVSLIYLQIAANCLAYMNSCINPALYAMASMVFRKAFLDLLCCRICKKEHADGSPNHTKMSRIPITTGTATTATQDFQSQQPLLHAAKFDKLTHPHKNGE